MRASAGPLRVAVVGADGRMGAAACGWIEAEPDLLLAARIERADDLREALRASEARVGLDLTVAGLGAAHGLAMLEQGVRPVIGTSGVTAEEAARLDERARALDLGGIVVPNFSLGVWLLLRAAEEAVRYVPRCEILELHDERKRDAPSGTALATAERLAAARGGGEVPIHSVRLPGVRSSQEVTFGAPGELLRLRHETYDRECFRPGLLASLRYAASAVGVARDVGVAFEHAARR